METIPDYRKLWKNLYNKLQITLNFVEVSNYHLRSSSVRSEFDTRLSH